MEKKFPAGIKKTRQREGVLSVLEKAKAPLGASDIYEKLKGGGETIWLSTVYRILEHFVQKDVVMKINVLDHEMAVYALSSDRHKHYAVCMNCHKIIAIDNCPMENFPLKMEEEFKILGHNLEVYGFCKDCNPK